MRPPSCGREAAQVVGRRPVALIASWAATAAQSLVTPAGRIIRSQCSPSVVRKITPARPTTQATSFDAAEPASRSAVTPLDCCCQVLPWSVERSMRPAAAQAPDCAAIGGRKRVHAQLGQRLSSRSIARSNLRRTDCADAASLASAAGLRCWPCRGTGGCWRSGLRAAAGAWSDERPAQQCLRNSGRRLRGFVPTERCRSRCRTAPARACSRLDCFASRIVDLLLCRLVAPGTGDFGRFSLAAQTACRLPTQEDWLAPSARRSPAQRCSGVIGGGLHRPAAPRDATPSTAAPRQRRRMRELSHHSQRCGDGQAAAPAGAAAGAGITAHGLTGRRFQGWLPAPREPAGSVRRPRSELPACVRSLVG